MPKETEALPNIFGEDTAPEVVEKETKPEVKTEKFADIPDNHPSIVALKGEVQRVKDEYGGNLSGQGKLIKELNQRLADLEGKGVKGSEGEDDVLYKKDDIKFSKDLSQDERDEMTNTEIKQMDEIANMKETQNKLYSEQKKGKKSDVEEKQNDLQGWVKSEAKTLAKSDVNLANEIIEAVKMFNLEGLDENAVRERVKMASAHAPSYKPPRENVSRTGKTVTGGEGAGDDPFGNNAIVESVIKGKDNKNYNL